MKIITDKHCLRDILIKGCRGIKGDKGIKDKTQRLHGLFEGKVCNVISFYCLLGSALGNMLKIPHLQTLTNEICLPFLNSIDVKLLFHICCFFCLFVYYFVKMIPIILKSVEIKFSVESKSQHGFKTKGVFQSIRFFLESNCSISTQIIILNPIYESVTTCQL